MRSPDQQEVIHIVSRLLCIEQAEDGGVAHTVEVDGPVLKKRFLSLFAEGNDQIEFLCPALSLFHESHLNFNHD